ncbi:MAG TPA: chromosomal replication initiator protein DnaA [Candidatus Fimimorpha excrementavium]|nr:chromosomal replication initiator protein DnaA [Candidatus Fimimorpha excrementavium]
MLEQLKEKWELIKNNLKEEYDITSVSFDTWIKPLELAAVEGEVVKVSVGDANDKFVIDYLTKKYQRLLQVMIEETTGFHCKVLFVMPGEVTVPSKKSKPSQDMTTMASLNANLNPRYTFDTFVVGANNKFAHAASLAVAESPAERYNPLYIYGGVGLGKTHLMHSIAHFIIKNDPTSKVLYVTSEKFTTELINAIRDSNKNSTANVEFREKYRNVDVLLIDDIQFITGKEGTQEEFFHTFNFLYENNKQIVISSDKPPKALEHLEERLRSRFEMGLLVDISAPDYETRMAILRKKEELDGYNIDNEIMKYIATNIKSNIRELEGALTKLTAYARLYQCDITLQTAEEALKDLISPNATREVTVDLIIEVVAEHFGFKPSEIASQKRNKEIVYPRQIAMYLCREMTSTSLQLIGKSLGKRDHTTILHGIEKIAADLKTNESLASTIDILKKKINPS